MDKETSLEVARAALLDALEALDPHRDAVILIGAQAIYLHTGEAPVALAPYTKDADLAIDARSLVDDPRIEEAMTAAGFVLDPQARQPGTWLSSTGVPVDLMVPEALSGPHGRRVHVSLRMLGTRHGAPSVWRLRSSTTRFDGLRPWTRSTRERSTCVSQARPLSLSASCTRSRNGRGPAALERQGRT